MNKRPITRFLALGGALAAALAACSGHEHDCDLNPYSCEEGGAGPGTTAVQCGPCEVDDGHGGCAPVAFLAAGQCGDKQVCAADLECRKAVGEPCGQASSCVTGVCLNSDGKTCATCAADADCLDHPDSNLCRGGYCRRAVGAACKTDAACATNLCADGACAACSLDTDCASGLCDDDSSACLAAAGEPCLISADCGSGLCDGLACAP